MHGLAERQPLALCPRMFTFAGYDMLGPQMLAGQVSGQIRRAGPEPGSHP